MAAIQWQSAASRKREIKHASGSALPPAARHNPGKDDPASPTGRISPNPAIFQPNRNFGEELPGAPNQGRIRVPSLPPRPDARCDHHLDISFRSRRVINRYDSGGRTGHRCRAYLFGSHLLACSPITHPPMRPAECQNNSATRSHGGARKRPKASRKTTVAASPATPPKQATNCRRASPRAIHSQTSCSSCSSGVRTRSATAR